MESSALISFIIVDLSQQTIESSGFVVSFWGFSQLGSSAFMTMRSFKYAHICFQVISLYKCNKVCLTNQQIFQTGIC